jgi:hypothetical protein
MVCAAYDKWLGAAATAALLMLLFVQKKKIG